MNILSSHSVVPPAGEKPPVIHLTDRAKARLAELMEQAPAQACAVAVTMKKGGCTGFIYEVDYTDTIAPGAEVIKGAFGTLVITPAAVLYLLGAEMDYEDNDLHSRFVFDNPNESSRCGCGLSITF